MSALSSNAPLSLVTGAPRDLAGPLVESLRHRTVARNLSLQARLLATVLGVMSVVWLAVAASTWYDTGHELDELLDAHLAQAAALLVTQRLDDLEGDNFPPPPTLHKYQTRVAIQAVSSSDQTLPETAPDGSGSGDIEGRPETQIGRFTVLRRIGKGGMGEVWVARDRQSGGKIALKLLKVEAAASKEQRGRFEREARIARSLQSPHITSVFDSGVDEDGSPFMAMELLGASVFPHVVIVCVFSYLLSGHRSIYPAQRLTRGKGGDPLSRPVPLRDLQHPVPSAK